MNQNKTNEKIKKARDREMLWNEILETEPSVYYTALSIPRENWTEETKRFVYMYEKRNK